MEDINIREITENEIQKKVENVEIMSKKSLILMNNNDKVKELKN